MILEYINSQGIKIDLREYKTRIYDGNFHNYNWEYDGVEQQLGVLLDRFTKKPLEYEMVVAFSGAEKKTNLNHFLQTTEYDVINEKPGRLYWGNYYLSCFIITSSTAPSEDFDGAERKVGVFAPYPFWIREISKTFYPETEDETKNTAEYLDYNYDYNYDYAPNAAGSQKWNTGHFASSDFQLIIYGTCINPRIVIAGHPYEVFDVLEKNEYMIIDSREHTVIKYRTNGTTEDLYDLRAKEQSIFEKIPGGNININWSGAFGFDLKLYLERSEPEWI